MYYEKEWEIKDSFFGLEHMEMQASKLLEENLGINPYEINEWTIIHPPTDLEWYNHDDVKYIFSNLNSSKGSRIDMRIYFKRIIRELKTRFSEYRNIQNDINTIYFRSYPNEKLLEIYFLPLDNNKDGNTDLNNKTKSRKYEMEIKVRNRKLVSRIKQAHNYRCQICGLSITKGVSPIEYYCEVHHLKPMAEDSEENQDVEGNLIVVCPNHHIEFQCKVIAINPEDQETIIHALGDENPFHGKPINGKEFHNIDYEFLKYHFQKFMEEGD